MSLFDRLLAQSLQPTKAPAPTPDAPKTTPDVVPDAQLEPAPVTRSERRQHIAEGLRRRNAPVDGVELVPGLQAPELLGRVSVAMVARGSCKAISADTGRQCALLAGHESLHRHGSTDFARVASSTQTHFPKRDALDALAASRNPSLTNPGE